MPGRQKRRVKHQEKIWHFMPEPERPCHNNQSEGAIRIFKVKQKSQLNLFNHRLTHHAHQIFRKCPRIIQRIKLNV